MRHHLPTSIFFSLLFHLRPPRSSERYRRFSPREAGAAATRSRNAGLLPRQYFSRKTGDIRGHISRRPSMIAAADHISRTAILRWPRLFDMILFDARCAHDMRANIRARQLAHWLPASRVAPATPPFNASAGCFLVKYFISFSSSVIAARRRRPSHRLEAMRSR